MTQYISILYYAVINFTNNEQGPVNKVEHLFCFLSMIISSILFTLLKSQISTINETMKKEQTDEEQINIKRWNVMNSLMLDKDIQNEINYFC